MIRKFQWVVLLLAGTGAIARAQIVSFNGLLPGQYTAGYTFEEGPFTVTALATDPGDTMTIVDVGAPNYNVFVDGDINDVYGTEIRITETDGGVFNLNAIDVADLGNQGGVTVSCSSGYRIQLTSSNGSCAVYGPADSTFQTVTAPSGFTDMSALTVTIVSSSPENFAVDNLNLSADAAEPSTVFLGLAGLTATACLARRRRTKHWTGCPLLP